MLKVTRAEVGDSVSLAIEPIALWPEPKVPADLTKALAAVPQARSLWMDITPVARWDWIRWIDAQSPLFKAEQIRVPLLIGQGANDPRVNKAESDQIVEAMRKKKLPVEYYVFPDEGHGFVRPVNRMTFNATTEQFLAKYLGGRSEPATDAEQKLLASIKH